MHFSQFPEHSIKYPSQIYSTTTVAYKMSNKDQIEYEVPIEAEEQAQLVELRTREQAIARVNAKLITLEGITCPEDITEDQECHQCGEDIPMQRVKALMTQIEVGDKLVWKASPNAIICVACASLNEKKGKQYWHGAKDDSPASSQFS
jgi:RNA polymerase-binding transcription factor DksA